MKCFKKLKALFQLNQKRKRKEFQNEYESLW